MERPVGVLDYVLMHEMTHLLYSNHSKEFWKKVNEYKYTERARGFLIVLLAGVQLPFLNSCRPEKEREATSLPEKNLVFRK